jgi:hypothetical protein
MTPQGTLAKIDQHIPYAYDSTRRQRKLKKVKRQNRKKGRKHNG